MGGRMHAPASVCRMSDLGGELDTLASGTGFSGVVRIDQSGQIELARAYGFAHRGFEIPNAVDTRFGLASGAKGFTALAVVSLIEEGVLELSTPARSVLGSDLPVIDDGVTVEHLLSHRSGIGDRSEEHTSELQSRLHLVCRLLLEKKKKHARPRPVNHSFSSQISQTAKL